jgi:hypothetical protein
MNMKELTCKFCHSTKLRGNGGRTGRQVFCKSCKKTFYLPLRQRITRPASTSIGDTYDAWRFGQPRSEARECLRIADANGGRSKMRELIQISERERRQLEKFAVAFPEHGSNISRAIEFRARVLEAFDDLAVSEEEKPLEEILATPPTAEEIASLAEGLKAMR